MKLIITRHGETEENQAGILQGHMPGKLSEEGKQQAEKVALRLKDEKIDHIYSSDLARAADTAREIAKFHPETPIEFVQILRERDVGQLQGKKKSEFNWYLEIGESMEQMYARAETFLQKILAQHPTDTVLFVGHNAINKTLIAVITGKKPEEIKEIEAQKNTSINIFEIDEKKNYKTHTFNCVKHLE